MTATGRSSHPTASVHPVIVVLSTGVLSIDPVSSRRSSSSASATSIGGSGAPCSRAARRRAATLCSSASMVSMSRMGVWAARPPTERSSRPTASVYPAFVVLSIGVLSTDRLSFGSARGVHPAAHPPRLSTAAGHPAREPHREEAPLIAARSRWSRCRARAEQMVPHAPRTCWRPDAETQRSTSAHSGAGLAMMEVILP